MFINREQKDLFLFEAFFEVIESLFAKFIFKETLILLWDFMLIQCRVLKYDVLIVLSVIFSEIIRSYKWNQHFWTHKELFNAIFVQFNQITNLSNEFIKMNKEIDKNAESEKTSEQRF
jgi:hypothetical protein